LRYRKVGLDIYISCNSRKLLSGIIESVGIAPALISRVILCIDRLEKIGSDGVEAELIQLGTGEQKLSMLPNYI